MEFSNETHWNISKTTCLTPYSNKIYLFNNQRYILIVLDVTLMILNLLANSAVLIVLFVSKFCQNTSSYILLFYLSMSDCFSALVAQPLYLILIARYFDQPYCKIEIVVNFFAVFLPHNSGYIVAAIDFDRYMRMRFLNRYHHVVTKQRTLISYCTITLVSLCEGLLYTLGTELNIFNICKTAVYVIDFFVIASVTTIYLLAVKVVKDYQKDSRNKSLFRNVNRSVTILASRILAIILILCGTYIIVSITYTILLTKVGLTGKSWLNFGIFLAYLITYCNSFANATLFLTTYKRSREKVFSFFNGGAVKRAERKNKTRFISLYK